MVTLRVIYNRTLRDDNGAILNRRAATPQFLPSTLYLLPKRSAPSPIKGQLTGNCHRLTFVRISPHLDSSRSDTYSQRMTNDE